MSRSQLLQIVLFLISINYFTIAQQCCEDYCYSTDSDRVQTRHFATKTAYEVVKGKESDTQHIVPNCEPSKFWLLSRHGTRLPSGKSIEDMRQLADLRDQIIDNYETRRSKPDRGKLCDDDLSLLRDWRWDTNITSAYDSFLTVQGWNDLKFLAIRYQNKFPYVLPRSYTTARYLFRHTQTQRTEASFKAFADGLFGENAYMNINLPEEPANDTLLKPYDFCPAYIDNKKNDPASELNRFINSTLYKGTLTDISTRLGFKFMLKDTQVATMYDMCRYEQAWILQELSPWCSVFTKDQINVLEYKEDLKYYYQNGYGHDLNSKIACHAVADMLQHLESQTDPLGIAYFTHEAEIQLFLTALGAVKDGDTLRSDNYFQMKKREWRSSMITPFAANVAVVKYQCNDPQEPTKVMFFLNEKPLRFDWCNVGLCRWSDVLLKYKNFKEADCAKEYCGNSKSSNLQIPSSILGILILAVIVVKNQFYC